MKCDNCHEKKRSAYPRPDLGNRVLCADCNHDELRRRSPSGLVEVLQHLRAAAIQLLE